jgi:hypothetical protein
LQQQQDSTPQETQGISHLNTGDKKLRGKRISQAGQQLMPAANYTLYDDSNEL